MGMKRSIPVEREDEFRADWATDPRTSDLAAKYGCSEASINSTARRLGLPLRRAGRRSRGEDVALLGGEWVKDGRGIMVWRPHAAPSTSAS